MSRAPLLAAALAVGILLAAPLSLHFEGNDGMLYPFLFLYPVAVLAGVAGAILAARRHRPAQVGIIAVPALIALAAWLAMLLYEGS